MYTVRSSLPAMLTAAVGLAGCGNLVLSLPSEALLGDTGEVTGDSGDQGDPEPRLQLSTSRIDAGEVEVGCEEVGAVNLRNSGDDVLEITNLENQIDPWTVDDAPDLPIELAPDESLELVLRFAPAAPGDIEGDLLIHSTDPDNPTKSLTLAGDGVSPPTGEVTFVQSSVSGLDLVVAVDPVAGNEDLLEGVAEGVSQMVPLLRTAGADVRIAGVVDDDGCVNGLLPYIDTSWSSSDAASAMETMLSQSEGEDGLDGQALALFDVAWEAMSSCNVELFGEGRNVHFLAVSRRADESPEGWASYLDRLQSRAETVVVHGIGGPFPDGCSDADPYSGIYEATLSSEGIFQSVCDPLDTNLSDLAEVLVGHTLRRVFPIDGSPDDNVVRVFVDGEELVEGWAYDPELGAVLLGDEHVPGIGAEILVSWVEAPECEA